MTVTMTAKSQITIPKRISKVLGLSKGSLFNIEVARNRIELVPVEVQEKTFSEDVYRKLDVICAKEAGKEKKISKKFIANLKSSKA